MESTDIHIASIISRRLNRATEREILLIALADGRTGTMIIHGMSESETLKKGASVFREKPEEVISMKKPGVLKSFKLCLKQLPWSAS